MYILTVHFVNNKLGSYKEETLYERATSLVQCKTVLMTVLFRLM
jgi:hypothetical protein